MQQEARRLATWLLSCIWEQWCGFETASDMPLPLANAALKGRDTEGWQPLKHGSPQSMWPSGTASAPAMPGQWQLQPKSFLSKSPFSAPIEGESMAPGAMNLLSAGRTPLVVTVLRENKESSLERGEIVYVRQCVGNTDYCRITIFDGPSFTREYLRIQPNPPDATHYTEFGRQGYVAVVSAHVEKGQEEVALSVGGVDFVTFRHGAHVHIGGTMTADQFSVTSPEIGRVYLPGFIPLTKPQKMRSSWGFSAYIETTMLTYNKSTLRNPFDTTTWLNGTFFDVGRINYGPPPTFGQPGATVSESVIAKIQTMKVKLKTQSAALNGGNPVDQEITDQHLDNSLLGFDFKNNVWQVMEDTVGAALFFNFNAQKKQRYEELYYLNYATLSTRDWFKNLKDPIDKKPLTKARRAQYLLNGTMYKVVRANRTIMG